MKWARRLGIAAATSAMLLAVEIGGLIPIQTASAAVQTAKLYTEHDRSSCPGGGTIGDAHGFAVISETDHSNQLVVDVSLTGGAANRRFDVHVIQCQGNSDSGRPTKVGTFTTDGDGNGSFHSHPVEMPAGVDGAFVGLFGGPDQIYATSAVPI